MNVKLSSADRRALARGEYRHPHSQPLPPGWWPGPWNEPIPPDAACTPLPADDDRPIHLSPSWRPPRGEGYDWATPYTVVTNGKPPRRTVGQWSEKRSLFENLANIAQRIPIVSTSQLPWVGGHPADPPTYGDRHYLVVDLERGELVEAINTRKGWGLWWFSRITRWDLNRPYAEQASKHNGVVAARLPKLAHTVRYDQVVNRPIDNAIGVALPRYAKGNPQFPAMATDGRYVTDQHGNEVREVPVYAGQRMRIRADVYDHLASTLPADSDRLVVVHALRAYGLVVADTTARNHGSAWMAPDGRYEGSDLDEFSLPISAFESVDII